MQYRNTVRTCKLNQLCRWDSFKLAANVLKCYTDDLEHVINQENMKHRRTVFVLLRWCIFISGAKCHTNMSAPSRVIKCIVSSTRNPLEVLNTSRTRCMVMLRLCQVGYFSGKLELNITIFTTTRDHERSSQQSKSTCERFQTPQKLFHACYAALA